MLEKEFIKAEVRRTAGENGKKPLGSRRFHKVTEISPSYWNGIYWGNYGELLDDAGFQPNKGDEKYDPEVLKLLLAQLARECKRFPRKADLMLKRRSEPSFPSHVAFERNLAKQRVDRIKVVATFCESRPDFADVQEICRAELEKAAKSGADTMPHRDPSEPPGVVYLLKLRKSRLYRIGSTQNFRRREQTHESQQPEGVRRVHTIKTDYPLAVEAYWHTRFSKRRKKNSWYELTAEDVAAFRRGKLI